MQVDGKVGAGEAGATLRGGRSGSGWDFGGYHSRAARKVECWPS